MTTHHLAITALSRGPNEPGALRAVHFTYCHFYVDFMPRHHINPITYSCALAVSLASPLPALPTAPALENHEIALDLNKNEL